MNQPENKAKAGLLLILGFSALSLASASRGLATEVASDWVQGFNNKARLLGGHATRDGQKALYAAVEIAMPEGWKTYWRAPGDAGGVPPDFDWKGSGNLAAAEILFPAPHRLRDKAGDAVGYKDHVIFPVRLTPTDASKAITIDAKVAYGVCKDICIPAEAQFQLTIAPDAGEADAITNVLAKVPTPFDRTKSDPKLAAWRVDQIGAKSKLVFAVATSSLVNVDAFVEGPAGIYVPLPKRMADVSGQANFEVDLTDGVDMKDLKGKPLTVTLVDDKGQSETTITLE